MHISEHTKYALGADFRQLNERDPDMARSWLEHIAHHKDIAVRQAMELAGQGDGGQAASNVLDGATPSEAASLASAQQGAVGGTIANS